VSLELKVLVYHIGSLGDTIVCIPALRALRHQFGNDARITLLHDVHDSGLVTAEAVLSCTHLVNGFLTYRFERSINRKARSAWSLHSLLRKNRFDVVVSLLPSDRSAKALWRDRLFFRLCGIRRMIGFRPIPISTVYPRDHGLALSTAHESAFRMRRLADAGISTEGNVYWRLPLIDITGADARAAIEWLHINRRYPERALIAICPGCKKPANVWDTERFIEIGRRLLATRAIELIVLGGPAERNSAERMIEAWGGEGIMAAGDFSVIGSAGLLSQCRLLVGLDTGTTHLAAAVGVRCVVVQSANSFPGHWDPLGDDHVVLRRSVPCAGCLQQKCPVEGHPCMNELTIAEVWRAVQKALSDEAANTVQHVQQPASKCSGEAGAKLE
jgi:ADP-heptose:LPS heptosyltransferase